MRGVEIGIGGKSRESARESRMGGEAKGLAGKQVAFRLSAGAGALFL